MIRGDFQASVWLDIQRLHQSLLEKPFAGRAMIELVRQALATQSC
jgi:hypothetical protein